MSDSNNMTIAGTVLRIDGPVSVGSNGLQKTTVIVRTPGQYPQEIPVEFLKDKAESVAKQYSAGDEVEVSFNLRGREYNGRHYVSVQGWKVALIGAGTGSAAGAQGDGEEDDKMAF